MVWIITDFWPLCGQAVLAQHDQAAYWGAIARESRF
jgi:hypothetical protein